MSPCLAPCSKFSMVQMDASFLVCTDTAPASEITDTDGAEGSSEPVPALSVGMVPVVRTWPPDSMFGSAAICKMLRITTCNLLIYHVAFLVNFKNLILIKQSLKCYSGL